jgi:phenylpropionate dioxygenase-like ring-hydroxylating dioxygenase large terminal subunit
VGRWGGFVFINADPNSAPLEEFLSVVPRHFQEFRPAERYTAARFRKNVPANWKIAQEAFMESYHVLATHPIGVPFNGDSQAQYDIWASEHSHVGRQITPSAVPSMHAGPEATTVAAGHAYAMTMQQWHYPECELPAIDAQQDVRAQIAAWHRAAQKKTYGREVSVPDAVMLDSTLYFMFPQSTFWLSESLPFTYAFTPHPTDPGQSYFEVRMLLPLKAGQKPSSAPLINVARDESIAERAQAFGYLGVIFDQDMANMPLIQAGVRTADPARRHSQLGTYQEAIIQHWNEVLDRCMSG